ncbi:hypothetical protein CHUAL_006845 [Chamberlinius hualienensis]
MSSEDVFEKTGLGNFIKMFRIFGFYFNTGINQPRKNHNCKTKSIVIIRLYYLMYFITLLVQLQKLWIHLANDDGKHRQIHWPQILADTMKRFSLLIVFAQMSTNSDKWAILLHQLAINIDQIQPQFRRIQTVKRIKVYVKWGIVIYVLLMINTIVALNVFYSHTFWYYDRASTVDVFNSVFWFIALPSMESFWVWMSISQILICRLMIIVIESNFQICQRIGQSNISSPSKNRFILKFRLMAHKKMSRLILKTEKLVANYLLITLILELLYIVSATTLYQSDEPKEILFVITFYMIVFSFSFILKAVSFSDVNEKFCYKVNDWTRLVHQLAVFVDSIQPQVYRVKAIKRIKSCAFWGIVVQVILIAYNLRNPVLFLTDIIIQPEFSAGYVLNALYNTKIYSVIQIAFVIGVNSFWSWIIISSLIVCELLNITLEWKFHTDYNKKRLRLKDIKNFLKQQIVAHSNISLLVEETEKLTSMLLLISLINEMLSMIAYSRFLYFKANHTAGLTFAIEMISETSFSFIIKATVFARINDKLKSSLTLNNVPTTEDDLAHCSAEHVNYLLYLNEQQINKAELTYGGFFPVRKTFIFTIAGTALTYALILNGINSP